MYIDLLMYITFNQDLTSHVSRAPRRYRRDKERIATANHLLFSLRIHSHIDNQHEDAARSAAKLANRLAELVEKDRVFLVPCLYSIKSASCTH